MRSPATRKIAHERHPFEREGQATDTQHPHRAWRRTPHSTWPHDQAGVPNALSHDSDGSSICKPIDEQPNDQIMPLNGCRKTDRLPHEAFDSCTPCGMFACDLLRLLFSPRMPGMIERAVIRTPPVCIQARDTLWLQEGFACQTALSCPCTKDRRSGLSCGVLTSRPEPSLVSFGLPKAPPLIHCRGLSCVEADLHRFKNNALE